ncbi:MAG: cell division protein FtsW [Bdellovibrionales bacterium RIFCSPHIGHO2_01_FULL_40_29]|nr:MAG: cell division protein FtsW [Bdellovibrionales bacterium RIFCSPHIGHO2_01_FULL_40_29]OFZ34012.1 MAG: cell division protein FtsW [Bdellovibrionales bacterium RIFCSPHIGHO2_02_FULL_40_15]
MKTKFLSSSLFLSIVALFGIGLVQVYSSSYIFATESYGDGLYFFKRQLVFTILAGFVLFSAVQIPPELIRKWGWVIWPVSFVLLVATFIPGLGVRVGGALRWIQLPFGIRFEPSELLKIAFSFLFASLVCRHQNHLKKVKWGWIFLIITLPMALLLKQPDFGSFMIIGLVATALLFTFGMNLKWLVLTGLAALPALYFIIWHSPYRRARVQAFLDPWSDPAQKGFQVIQSMLSVHSGGLSGQGLGQGQGKLFFLPEAHTDFTIAVFSEEMGFLGLMALLGLYIFVIFRGFQIAIKTADQFRKTLVLGLVLTFAISVFINCGVVMGLLPTKGLTMPFLSYGGSSLIILSFLFGIILNVEMHEN